MKITSKTIISSDLLMQLLLRWSATASACFRNESNCKEMKFLSCIICGKGKALTNGTYALLINDDLFVDESS